jgi:hypothetical protein
MQTFLLLRPQSGRIEPEISSHSRTFERNQMKPVMILENPRKQGYSDGNRRFDWMPENGG